MPNINEIVWVDFLISNPREISIEEVQAWERQFDYTLPEDFREIARKNQARLPRLEDKNANNDTTLDMLAGIFHFENNIEPDFQLGRIGYIEEHRPGALVFVDCSGDYIAFDFGEDGHKNNPPIIYYDHETKEIETIAESFTELLQKCLEGSILRV